MTGLKKVILLATAGFVVLCGILVVQSGILKTCSKCILLQNTASQDSAPDQKQSDANANPQLKADSSIQLGADHAEEKMVVLGSTDPNSQFKFEVKLTSKGAAVESVTSREFKNRDRKNPQPLTILSPVNLPGGRQVLSFANTGFLFADQHLKLPLEQLHWKTLPLEELHDGSQSVSFEAVILDKSDNHPVAKLVKKYKVSPLSYDIDCNLTVENLRASEQDIKFNLNGPVGINKESFRGDMRKVIGGFRQDKGQVASTRLEIKNLKGQPVEKRKLTSMGTFLWAAITNKYFAAVVVPFADKTNRPDWLVEEVGQYYNPDSDAKDDSGDETIGLDFAIRAKLTPAGVMGSSKDFSFKIFVGPKDKRLFDKNPQYKSLGFEQTIDFGACCCPMAIISPLAFGILAIMEWLYYIIPNYGIAIIILVFLIRLVTHPLTKKSQVSMGKMGKLSPKMEEIKKKYANDKAEMNKQVMALYKEHGASPFLGMIPMFVQMPIWIALYSAIDASVALRGAPFLPFWITDLSAPDALIRFTEISLPIFGKLNSLNLLPILMGVAFYLQQKMTPTQPSASANPQMEQQQKMMKIMMPLLFPLMLYNSPSGLNLYIMASTFVGVIEQKIIIKHIKEQEQQQDQGLVDVTSKTGGKVKKKKAKPFFKM